MQNSKRFATEKISLKKVSNTRFIIPTYQRPYVWQEEQISKLIKDCASAFLAMPNESYFIGTILTSCKEGRQELIDGQQRFTTLWLVAVVFHKLGIKTTLTRYLNEGKELRLGFEIRKEIEEYFSLLEAKPNDIIEKYSEEELENSLYLGAISKAVSTIESILLTLEEDFKETIDLAKFGDYLFEKVLMINNSTPQGVDLNKLFATINNSGVQLEQTDIVKANLLKCIHKDKVIYSKIWESCENMNDYFERNVRRVFSKTDWNALNPLHFSTFDIRKFKLQETEKLPKDSSLLTIREILSSYSDNTGKSNVKNKQEENEEIYCRSIIDFGQLLLHSYRIFLKRKKQEDFSGIFHTNRLIEVFKTLEQETEQEVKAFFELLWQVRYHFDKEVIKWVVDLDSKNEHLELSQVYESAANINRTKQFQRKIIERNAATMLQSVLYFTGDYLRQYWLSPFLYRLIDGKETSINLLESIDNDLSISQLQDKIVSYLLCSPNYREETSISLDTELNTPKGTRFKHYWFQKLEYILWKEWDKTDSKIKHFRITSKNSVEHVFPQKHEFKEVLEEDSLDCFGNLGLLSVSQNSSYSNQDVRKKKVDFDKKEVYDSLKLAKIYSDKNINNWGINEIKNHQKEMIEKIIAHYNL